jgi:hypothetical protein
MTDNNHPITPPPELVQQWSSESLATQHLCTRAARWGVDQAITELAQQIADQELDACCEWLDKQTLCGHHELIPALRDARRPKPPSVKEQALSELNLTADPDGAELSRTQVELIRRALEQLDD